MRRDSETGAIGLPRAVTALLLAAGMSALTACSSDPEMAPTAVNIPAGNGVCLPVNGITRTEVVDDSTILFHMAGGKVWINSLIFPCAGLKFEGSFAYTAEVKEVCSNGQTIRVLHTGNFCELGQFIEAPEISPPATPRR